MQRWPDTRIGLKSVCFLRPFKELPITPPCGKFELFGRPLYAAAAESFPSCFKSGGLPSLPATSSTLKGRLKW
jgi:hypothetical protein